MSGTQDEIGAAQIYESAQPPQPGAADDEKKVLNQSERMNAFIRTHSSPKMMQREIEKLRKESAKYRSNSVEESQQREEIQKKASEVQADFDALKAEHRSLKIMRALDKAGCVKSDLVAKAVPSDCEDFDGFAQDYKEENPFLFNIKKQSHGGTFKPSTTVNLTASQKMDRFIRKSLGR